MEVLNGMENPFPSDDDFNLHIYFPPGSGEFQIDIPVGTDAEKICRRASAKKLGAVESGRILKCPPGSITFAN